MTKDERMLIDIIEVALSIATKTNDLKQLHSLIQSAHDIVEQIQKAEAERVMELKGLPDLEKKRGDIR